MHQTSRLRTALAVFLLAAPLGGAAAFVPPPAGAGTTAGVCPDPGTVLYPELRGAVLTDSLRAAFRPPVGLDYAAARNVMYSLIDNHGGRVSCVYTGFSVTVDPASADPKTVAFDAGINTEHTWPKSKGAEHLPAEADMHHLFPTEINANAVRGNYPFAEIPDEETDLWFRLKQVLSVPDPQQLAAYSEFDGSYPGTAYAGRWEPPEDQKGNVARAMFYFYTVYRSEVDAADPGFIAVQKDDLRAWHDADPVDEDEYVRTCAIAPYQAGRVNPFVIDATLVERAYFDGVPVRLLAFGAEPTAGGVRLAWRTRDETGHAGFDVIRVEGDRETQLTLALITDGPVYEYVDRSGRPGARYDYWLEALARDGSRERFGPRSAVYPGAALSVFARPNPARAGQTVRFEVAGAEPETADLFDLAGRRVRSWQGPGDLARGWDGRRESGGRAAPGVYFLRVAAGGEVRSVRVVLIQ